MIGQTIEEMGALAWDLLLLAKSSHDVVVLLLLGVITAIIGCSRCWSKRRRRRSSSHGDGDGDSSSVLLGPPPPGSVGLPVLGETLRLIAAYKTEDPEPFIDERVARHGRVFTSHVFGERTVFSVDPEFNRLLLGAEGRSFHCSYPSSISTLLGPHSLLLLKGARHKRMHSLVLTRLASPAAIRDSPLLLRDMDRLIRSTLASWGHAARVLLLDQAKKITFELTVKQLMSVGPGEWTEALRREYLRLIEGFFAIPFPALLSFTTYGKALKARKMVAEALREVIRKRKEEKGGLVGGEHEHEHEEPEDSGSSSVTGTSSSSSSSMDGHHNHKSKDMLAELLDAEEGLSEEEMVDFLLALLVAGYETTPTIMTLAVKFLTDSPSALALLREEHHKIRASKKDEIEPLEWSDYKSMPFTQCVINETLRVANIIGGVFRRAATDVQFKGYTIPKGCKVFASFRAVHLDPVYYEDARNFNPWRWQKDDALVQASGAGVFTPFGGGPRLCPGYELARVVISVFLHHLVTRFSWDAAEKDRLVFFPTTRMLKGYPINVYKRGSASW